MLSHDNSSSTRRIRLHITPFNPQLRDRIIPPSLQPQASNYSFHAVSTFSELGFGYVELPAMDAEKLKNKLNGTTLKGAKVRIEEAKPEKKRKVLEAEVGGEVEEQERRARKKARKEEKKRKREDGVIPGHELEKGRHVKRGWTEGTGESKIKSKERKEEKKDGSEPITVSDVPASTVKDRKLKFKTVVPDNVKHVDVTMKSKSKKRRSKEKGPREKYVVEEFKKHKRTQDQPLKSGIKKRILYEDGKGWIDEDGVVVEPERSSRNKRVKSSHGRDKSPDPVDTTEPQLHTKDTSPAMSSLPSSTAQPQQEQSKPLALSSSPTPSSASESDEASSSVSSNDHEESETSQEPNSPEQTGQVVQSEQTPEVHPLEALFKRNAPTNDSSDTNTPTSKPRPTPIHTSFSFFDTGPVDGSDDLDSNPGSVIMPPHTPHTKQDLEWRGLRSAAPTPDTAAIGKKFDFPFGGGSDEDDGDEGVTPDVEKEDEDVTMDLDEAAGSRQRTQSAQPQEESEFHKWFYDNRGDLNRGWKKRRREARKVVRQRENRRLTRKMGFA
ncbi:hypothetical protein K431DRAFT_281545 [Polychaeton citri CBS 116435]|uniref:RRM domain-containing protein n=1 Tax=Polychaeton citri CBS 116435 TaxID=1314669 RepID=A0A9P4UTV2_9PEZI|nr:hypothetical protein K431DRAFT_281545 [Polychaeton citri CBS 116435]